MLRLAALLTLAVFAPALATDGVFISAELTLFGNGVVPCTSRVHTAIMASLPDAVPGVVVVGIRLTDPKVRGPQRAPNSVPAAVPGAAPAAAGAPNSGTHSSVTNPSGPCPSSPRQVHQTNWQQARRCRRTNASQAEVASQARTGLYVGPVTQQPLRRKRECAGSQGCRRLLARGAACQDAEPGLLMSRSLCLTFLP